MSHCSRFVVCLLALLGAGSMGLESQTARAGGLTACDSPFVFDGAAANIVPIEFLATAGDVHSSESQRLERLQRTARRLAWLFKLDSWNQPTYGSLGVVAHLFLDRKCDPDEVIEGLLQGRSGPAMPAGQILLVLQGRLFIEGEEIFLQSRLRGYRRNELSYGEADDLAGHFEPGSFEAALREKPYRLRARLPVFDITFAPRVLTYGELDRIDADFSNVSRVYDAPNRDAASQPLEFRPDSRYAFSVRLQGDGEWIEIDDYFGGLSGFIRTDPDASSFLHARLPELDFLNGLLGYLRIRQARQDNHAFRPPPRSATRQARTSLMRFLDRPDAAAEESAAPALANVLLGILSAERESDWVTARARFREAVRLAPYNSDYRNLLGMANAHICCDGTALDSFDDPSVDFAESLSLDPENLLALRNLDAFLTLLSDFEDTSPYPPPPGINLSRLEERREVVQRVVTGFERRND